MKRRYKIWMAAVAGLLILAGFAAVYRYGQKSGPVQNLLLITMDTTRADRLGCYGYARARTPAVDQLAAAGTRFSRAYCNVPLTLPSHTTMMTGLYPPEHGCRVNGVNALPQDIPVLAELCREHDMATAAFVASFVLDSQFGLDRGFDHYDDYDVPMPEDLYDANIMYRYRRGDEVADRALAWLREHAGESFFCWVHFFDPHRPYYFPADPYDNEVAYMDQQIGRLLAFLQQHDLDRETLIVALGDHGEGLGDHGEDEHGLLLYDATMHIPMMFAGPGIPAGMKVSCPVSTVDLLPTIVDALHLDPPRTLNGRNLMTAFRGKTLSAQPIYMETEFPLTEYGWSPLQAVCRDGWKFIRAPQNELYNLDIDTGEMTNRLAAEPARAKALRNVLQTVESLMQVQAAEEVEIDAVDRQALESLGYTGGGGQRAREGDILRNPMKFIGLRSEFIRAVGFIEAGRTELAVPILRTLIAASPESYIFHYKLAKIHFEQGRYAKALEEFEEMARMCPDEFRTHYNLGKTLIKLGEYDRAVRELNLALELNDRQVDGYNNLGIALLKTGDWQAAVEAFKRSIAIDADQCDPHNNMGNALMAAGQLQGAIDAYIQAVDADPDSFEARYNLGSALVKRSDWQEAIPHLEKVIQLRPGFEPGRRLLAQAVLQTRQGAIGN